MLKKIVSLILSFSLIFTSSSFVFAKEESKNEVDMDIQSKSVVLMDAGTGKVLYEKNKDEKLPLASVTKVMTILLILEAVNNKTINMSDMVTISDYASKMGGSQLFMEEGEMRSVDELLNAIIIESANDACAAMGEFVGGSIEKFVLMMNDRAKELGMKNSHFVNSNGLPADDHYSSAYDIALMTKEVCKYPDIFKISSTWQKTIKIGKKNDKERTLSNTNKLLRMNDKVDGLKTGYTADAGHCISATGKEGDLRLIAVILHAPDSKTRFAEANKLLNYGFSTYKAENVVEKDKAVADVEVNKGNKDKVSAIAKDNISTLMNKNENKEYKSDVKLDNKKINAPVKKGDKLGSVSVSDGDKVIGTSDLIANEDVERVGAFDFITNTFRQFVMMR